MSFFIGVGIFVTALVGLAMVGSVLVWWNALGNEARGLRAEIRRARRTEARMKAVERIIKETPRRWCDPRCVRERWKRTADLTNERGPDCDCGAWALNNYLSGQDATSFSLADDFHRDARAYETGEFPAGYFPEDEAADPPAEGGPA